MELNIGTEAAFGERNDQPISEYKQTKEFNNRFKRKAVDNV